eukprot:COSAG01_NODE_44796_length_415_cov_1.791139_1_plen_39_part_01
MAARVRSFGEVYQFRVGIRPPPAVAAGEASPAAAAEAEW